MLAVSNYTADAALAGEGGWGGRLLSCLEKFPNLFREKKEPQEIVLNKFLTNSDINIFGIYSEYIRRNFYPNILKRNMNTLDYISKIWNYFQSCANSAQQLVS